MTKLSVHQRKARDFIQREDWSNALVELERMLGVDVGNPTLHNQIGDVYLRKEDVIQAVEHFEKAIDLYATVGLHNNAVALCKKIMRLRPGRVEIRYRLARLRLEQGFRSEAAIFFREYLEHLQSEDPDVLEQHCREIVELVPDEAPIGLVLEKLEGAARFVAAFEIVRSLAQRAADAQDDAASKRYNEKMRSLRVLVERSGGRDLLAEPLGGGMGHVAEPAGRNGAESSPAALKSGPTGGARPAFEPNVLDLGPSRGKPSVAAPEPMVVDHTPVVPASFIAAAGDRFATASELSEMPAVDEGLGLDAAVWNELAAADAGADLEPSFEIDLESPLETVASAPSPEDDFALSLPPGVRLISPAPEPEDLVPNGSAAGAELAPFAMTPPFDGSAVELDFDSGAGEPRFGDLAAALRGRAETPVETSGVDAALELAPEVHPESTLSQEFAPVLPPQHVVNASAELISEVAPEWGIETIPVWDPHSLVEPDAPAARPSLSGSEWVDELRRSPVWIPTGDTLTEPDPLRPDRGLSMELESVIDSFREQMSRALDGDGSARYDLGVAYFDMGLYNEALAEFEAAATSPGLEVQCFEMLAQCLLQTGRHAEVVELLVPVVAAEGHEPRGKLGLQYCLGLAYEALEDHAQARRFFEEVALVDVDFRDVQSRLERT